MKKLYCLLIFLSVGLWGYAILPTHFQFRHYNIENGVSSNSISAILQDSHGYIWLGTDNGLSRFDGNQFAFYQKSNPLYSNLHTSYINTLCEINTNELWLGTENGVYIYNPVKATFTPFTQKTNDNTGITSWIMHIIQDKEQNIWIATRKQGIFQYNTSTHKLTQYEIPRNNNAVIHILNDRQNNIWISGPYQLFRLNKANNTFEEFPIKGEPEGVYSMALWEDSSHNLWIGTWEQGLWKLNTQTHEVEKFLVSNNGKGILHIHSILEYSPTILFIGSDEGLTVFNPITQESFLYNQYGEGNESLSDKFIYPMLKDREGGVWIGTYYNGVNYLPPFCGQFPGYSGTDNLPFFEGQIISRFCEGKNGEVWIGSDDAGVSCFNPSIGKFIDFPGREKKHAKAIDELNSKKEIEIHEAKINFFTMIAHEIRTPVSLIIGPLEKIMQSTHIPINERQELEIIDRNSQRLLYLVNQLLDFRKVEQKEIRMKFTSQSIKELMQAVCERFSPTLQQNGVSFSVTYPDEHFHADVDKEALTKVLSNLLTNANKYTQSMIEVRFQEHPERQTFSIEVKDNGKGMNEEELKKIFKPFYQASENKPGTGIGLSIVKGIVEAHHGQVNVTSQPGKGSSFIITLPRKQENLVTEEEENQATNPIPEDIIPEQNDTAATSQKVLPIMLIVDDNEDMLNFLSSHFQTSYTIVTAVDGVDALNKLKEQEVALIISDWMMPNMNGIDLCKAVRNNQLTSHIPFILLTAKTDTEAKITSMNCGADAYIEKPFSLQYLEACIKNLLELRLQLRQKFSQMPTVSINSIAANQNDKVFLEKMNHLIEENLNNEELSVDFLAEKLCISRSGLFVKIKGLANTTPNEMIQIIRLKKAASLLLEKQYRINEVSYMVGFNNPSYFSKCFQKQFGMKPGEYIASHAHKAE